MKQMKRMAVVVGILCMMRLWCPGAALAATTVPPEIDITETKAAVPNPVGVKETFRGTLTVASKVSAAHDEFPAGTTFSWQVMSVSKDGKLDNSLIKQIMPTNGTGQKYSYSGSLTEVGVYAIKLQATVQNSTWNPTSISTSYTVTVLVGSVVIDDFYRVAPTKDQVIKITSTPAKLPTGYSFLVLCETDPGTTGRARVLPAILLGSGAVTVTGLSQSWGAGDKPAPRNIKLRVKLGNIVCAEKAFTVCAHPVNFSTDYYSTDGTKNPAVYNIYTADDVGLAAANDWESDSGTLTDLDKVPHSEDVKAGTRDDPPFTVAGPFEVGGYGPSVNPPSSDWHTYPITKITTGAAGKFVTYQLFKYKCARCGDSDKVCSNSGFVITLELKNVGGVWKTTTTKEGAAVTTDAGSATAGSGKVSSDPQQVPYTP